MSAESRAGGITSGKENYLKAILELSRGSLSDTGVRAVDVAAALGVSKASVSVMLGKLKEDGYVIREKNSSLSLTKKGFDEARRVKRRNALLRQYFIKILGVDSLTAEKDACRIEHIISTQSIDRIYEQLSLSQTAANGNSNEIHTPKEV
jgi:Mn-dependent DtxR family transcriptional regulator